MNLSDYVTNTRDLLHDPKANFYSVTQVNSWVNRARSQVAQTGRCVRYLIPGMASIESITVTSGGSGYTTASATISAPDGVSRLAVQAEATVTVTAGAVTSINVTNPGFGYIGPATVTIEGTGTGAMGSPVLSPHAFTTPQQEVYRHADLTQIAQALKPGIGALMGIQSIATSWGGSIVPLLRKRSFTYLQAVWRSYGRVWSNYPEIWAPYQDGENGSFYLQPVPFQYQELGIDGYYDVQALSTTQTADLIPTPWNEPCFYYAAYLAYRNAQRADDARDMLSEYDRLMKQARSTVEPDSVPDPYGVDTW